jgi:hypothetical protein
LITKTSLQPSAASADETSVEGPLQAFDLWMNDGGPLIVLAAALAFGVLGPVFALVHELGHASVGLARTRGRVRIRVGVQPGRWQFQLGRLDLSLSPYIPFRSRFGGDATPLVPLDKTTRIAFIIGGPIASFILAGAITAAGIWTGHDFVIALGCLAVVHTLLVSQPFCPAGHRTDGRALLEAIRRPAVYDRWVALYRDVEGTLGPERGRVMNAVPVLVGHPGKGPDAAGVWWIAFAGWCWRAASGDEWREMHDAALAAVHEATQTGAVEPDLTIVAARSLAARESSAALTKLQLDSVPVDVAKQQWAFQFGVAFYDIERARGSTD